MNNVYLIRFPSHHFELLMGQPKRSRDSKLAKLAIGDDHLDDVRIRPIGYVDSELILEVRGNLTKDADEDKIDDYMASRIPTVRSWDEKHDGDDFPMVPRFSIGVGSLGILFVPSGLEHIYNSWTVQAYRWVYSKAYGNDAGGTYSLVVF